MDENEIYDTEVPLKEIIKQMKLNIYNNFTSYNNPLINIDYLLYRPSIFSLIRKISNKIGFKSQTFFLSIYYLDILHLKNQKIDLDLKVLSLACLLLAAKYAENDQNVPNLPIFVTIFNSIVRYKDIISNKELFFAEVVTCKLMEYKLNYYTIYDFNSFFFGHGIIKIEQLKELHNENFNGINVDLSENSFFIRKILEKIYRQSRYYLDIIINSGNICLKYSSLIISVVIMKKSVEDILIKEQKIKEYDMKEFKEKTAKCFKEIMLEIYQIDYESMEDYQNLISENELQYIFQENNKRNSNYIKDNNLNFLSEKENTNKLNTNNRYGNILNNTLNGKVFIKKFNFSQNIDGYNYKRRNESGMESGEDFLYSNKFKKERVSVPKGYYLDKKYIDLANFNSSFSNNCSISKNINLSHHQERKERSRVKDMSLKKHSELNSLSNYLHTYTNQFYHKKREEINTINQDIIKNMKNININDSYEETKNLINIMDNNKTLPNDNEVLNKEGFKKVRNFEKYKKMVLRKRFFDRINKTKDYSVSRLDDSNTLYNIDTYNEKLQNQNIQKPYFKKVIKNVTNYTIKSRSNVNSFYSTMNNNMYNPNRRKQNKMIILNAFPFNKKENNNIASDHELNINKVANENKSNVTLEAIKSINARNNYKKNIFNKKNLLFNQRKKIYSNNILLNSMTLDNQNNNIIKKEEKDEILLTANNDLINQKNERQKLLFLRMKNINNKINFKNSLNNTEIKNNEFKNQISKRKFLISNNIKNEIMNLPLKQNSEHSSINNNKDKIYENQILNKYGNSKKDMNKNTTSNFIIKELKTKSITTKYINVKNSENNIPGKNKISQKDFKKEKINFPKSSIFKLINRTKTLNVNKLDLSKQELNSALVSKFTKNINNYNSNQNKQNKILKNIQTLDFNNQENSIIEQKNIQKVLFNTINNNNFNDKKEKNLEDINNNIKDSATQSYHYKNYMKNIIQKETNSNKTKNKNISNDNSKTIVINNNININFNNKIDNSNIYQGNKNENINKQINYHSKGTIECTNVNKKNGLNNNNNISSLLHRLPFYKKNLANNKNAFFEDNSKIKIDN